MLVIPNSLSPGEPGTEFTLQMQDLIWTMTHRNYYPVDFCEGNDTHLSIWFSKAPTNDKAKEQAAFFIKRGGDV
jgi:hypothetical protein